MHTRDFAGRAPFARRRRTSTLTLALATLASCAGDGTVSPGEAAKRSEISALDPRKDTFGSSASPWDIISFTMGRDGDGVVMRLEFTTDVVPPIGGDASAVVAFIDVDLDQNVATGRPSEVDHFRMDGGATALGVERTIDISELAPDGSATVYGIRGDSLGRIMPVYAGRTLTLHLGPELLGGDDGYVNAAAIVGTVGCASDVAPTGGNLALPRTSTATSAPRVTAVLRARSRDLR
jgi:hypothetical protein